MSDDKPVHAQRIRPQNIPLTTKTHNALLSDARRITHNFLTALDDYPDRAEDVRLDPHLKTMLEKHGDAMGAALEAGLEHALLGQSTHEIRKPNGEGWLLDCHMPETAAELQTSLLRSVEYTKAVLSEIPGLSDEAKQFGIVVYADISNHLMEEVEALQMAAGVRGQRGPR